MLKRLFSTSKPSRKTGRQTEKKKSKKPQPKTADRKKEDKKSPKIKRVRMEIPQRKGAFDALFLYDLMQKECDREVDPSAALFLEGVLNYMGTEIMELSYNKAKERSKEGFCMITPDDIYNAVEEDEELRYMIKFKETTKTQIVVEEAPDSDVDMAE